MHELTQLIRTDMKPALGVTEPGAIAYAVSTARSYLRGKADRIHLRLNSGMFKNAFTCGIPGSRHIGNEYAAALGLVMADPKKELLCLEGVTPEDEHRAEAMVAEGRVTVEMAGITSRIYIEASVISVRETVSVTIRDTHTNIVRITRNGEVLSEASGPEADAEEEEPPLIHRYTLAQILEYVQNVPAEEIAFLTEAYEVNLKLFHEGLGSNRTTFAPMLYQKNGNNVISDDELQTASLLCNAAIEARVIGLSRPAMSITGSGAHGIIATLPLYAVYKVYGCSEEALHRATALSYLICMYIKEYSGKLSAFCGCAIAAGTGMACGVVWLKGGDPEAVARTIDNMSASITGMICDGGNQGCTMKGIVAVDAAFRSAELALGGAYILPEHGINADTPEKTMRNMGRIAAPGMTGTEETILEILEEKRKVL